MMAHRNRKGELKKSPSSWMTMREAVLATGPRCPTYHMRATPEGVRACLRYLQEVAGYEVHLVNTRSTEPTVKLKRRRIALVGARITRNVS